jgi:hypothetical protein
VIPSTSVGALRERSAERPSNGVDCDEKYTKWARHG